MAITTNREYLMASLSRFGLTDADIDLIMVENPALDGNLDVDACKKAMYSKISAILPVANVSEGDYSITWNMDAIKLWYKQLAFELKKPNVLQPQVRNRSNAW